MTRSNVLTEAREWARLYKGMYEELSEEYNGLLDSFRELSDEYDGLLDSLRILSKGTHEALSEENQKLLDIIDAAKCILNGDEIPFDFLGGYMSGDDTIEEEYPWEYDSGR